MRILHRLARQTRLKRELAAHDRYEVDLAALEPPSGGAECGCSWQYLPGGHMRVDLCGRHAFICDPGGET